MNYILSLIIKSLSFVPVEKIERLVEEIKIQRLRRRYGSDIRFINQGNGGLVITGKPKNFRTNSTSFLKSNTYIETSGGVEIGKYFHVGRGLTIISRNHHYNSDKQIPYDETSIPGKVTIGDFVWAGANVTILPGVTIGEGAIIGACAVVTKDVAPYTIVAGNPAKQIGGRDKDIFIKLKKQGAFHL